MPQGAFYAFPNVRELGLPSFDCAMYLLDHAKVSTVPRIGFGKYGEGYLRIPYATSLENLLEAVKRIEATIKKMQA